MANALDSLKAGAGYITTGENGAGVREIIESLIAKDLPAPYKEEAGQRPGLLDPNLD